MFTALVKFKNEAGPVSFFGQDPESLNKLVTMDNVEWVHVLSSAGYSVNNLYSDASGTPLHPSPNGGMTWEKLTELSRYSRERRGIPAIKLIRSVYGCGLKEAKDLYDDLARISLGTYPSS